MGYAVCNLPVPDDGGKLRDTNVLDPAQRDVNASADLPTIEHGVRNALRHADQPGESSADQLVKQSIRRALFGPRVPSSGPTMNCGRYQLHGRLGSGATGHVFSARDTREDRDVAIKQLRAGALSPSSKRRLVREARVLKRLSHPNVLRIHATFWEGSNLHLVTERVSGVRLDKLLSQRRPPVARGWASVVEIFVQVGRGLAATHAAGFLHRDFKPENVVVDDQGRAVLIDFGLARTQRSGELAHRGGDDAFISITEPGAILGTPAFMSPEQWAGQRATRSSDQWSFCVALYEALYGKRPFSGATLAELEQQIERAQLPERHPMAMVPPRLHGIIARGTERRPEHRYASMDDLVTALEDCLARRRSIIVAASAVALLVVTCAIVAAWAVFR